MNMNEIDNLSSRVLVLLFHDLAIMHGDLIIAIVFQPQFQRYSKHADDEAAMGGCKSRDLSPPLCLPQCLPWEPVNGRQLTFY